MRINHEQKEIILEIIKTYGTIKSASEKTGIPLESIKHELKKSTVFKKRISEARLEGKQNLAENAIDKIREYAFNPPIKTDRNVLTAAIALANAFEPGFRGTSKVEGKIEHDVRVITAVPRPKYDELPDIKVLDKPKTKTIRTEIKDDKGNLLAIKNETVEEAIEGEVINEQ